MFQNFGNIIKQPVLIFIGILISLTGDSAMGQNALERLKSIARSLPAAIEGWTKLSDNELYSPQNLYEYINGGAELYISYQFKHLLTQSYTDSDSTEIRIDLFDMGSSFNAYGIFSHGREAVDQFVAQLLLIHHKLHHPQKANRKLQYNPDQSRHRRIKRLPHFRWN